MRNPRLCASSPADPRTHRHPVDIRPAGPDYGRHHDQWWIRDLGCDVTWLQGGPNPEPWTPPYDERTAT